MILSTLCSFQLAQVCFTLGCESWLNMVWWCHAVVWVVGCRPFLKLLPDDLADCGKSAHSFCMDHRLREGTVCLICSLWPDP